jgi:hypothetical protein
MKKYVAISILFFLMLTPSCYSQSFSLKLHIEKNNYLSREPITILAELINNDMQEYFLKRPNFTYGGLNLIMKNQNGEVVPRYKYGMPNKIKMILLKPSEHAYYNFLVTPLNYANEHYDEIGYPLASIKPGKYSVQFEYIYSVSDTKNNKIKKKYYSNIEEIIITEPKNEVDINALKDFDELLLKYDKDKSSLIWNKPGLFIEELKNLTKKYVESNYLSLFYYELFRNLSLNDPDQIANYLPGICSQLLNSFRTLYFMGANTEFSSALIKDANIKNKITGTLIEEYYEKIQKYERTMMIREVNQNDK